MAQYGDVTATSSTPGGTGPGIRIGHEERAAAERALDAHLEAGRLDAEEYGERYARAASARTQDELDALFTDLPQPHARPLSPPPPAWTPPSSPYPRPGAVRPLGGRLGVTLAALIPLIAVALFFASGAWIVFLLIPLVATMVYGPGGGRRGGMCGMRWGRW